MKKQPIERIIQSDIICCMVYLGSADKLIIISFLSFLVLIGFLSSRRRSSGRADYLLNGRRTGLFLFIATNVSTWYGGILGVGEFTYSYGLLNWFTQGFPYYIFALVFAFLFAGKIRNASLFTIPDKIESVYGRKAAIAAAFLVFILVQPAPYMLMVGELISMIFGLSLPVSLLIGSLVILPFIMKGGLKTDLYTDLFQFFIMFAGFIIILAFSVKSAGGFSFLKASLPPEHLTLSGGAPPSYIIIWFVIALWTFVDPGFHQRCYAAKDADVAKKGIIISVALWFLFDFLTTSAGLYSRAFLPGLENPVQAFPMLAEKVLGSGFKGIFYAGMLATILSTLNSFLFLSGTTFSEDFVSRISGKEWKSKEYTYAGIIFAAAIGIIMSISFPSVVKLWYVIGSICIPGLILPVVSSYYGKISIQSGYLLAEMISATLVSIIWFILREALLFETPLYQIEPMLAGLAAAAAVHAAGIFSKKKYGLSENSVA